MLVCVPTCSTVPKSAKEGSAPLDETDHDSLILVTHPMLSLSARQRYLDEFASSGKHIYCIRPSAALLVLAYANSPAGKKTMRNQWGETTVLVLEALGGYSSASFVRVTIAADALFSTAEATGAVSMTVRVEMIAARRAEHSCIDEGNARALVRDCCDKQAQLVSRERTRRPALLHNDNNDKGSESDNSPDSSAAPSIILHWMTDGATTLPLLTQSLKLFPGAAIVEAPAGHAALEAGGVVARGAADQPNVIHVFGSVHEFCVGVFVSINGSAPKDMDGVVWLIGSCCCKHFSNSNAAEVLLIHRDGDGSLVDVYLVPQQELDPTQELRSSHKPNHTYRVPSGSSAFLQVVQHLSQSEFAETVAEVTTLTAAHPLLVSIDCRGGALAVTARRLSGFRSVTRMLILREFLAAVLPIVVRVGLALGLAAVAASVCDIIGLGVRFRKGILRTAE